jgi:hypothetical protein
VTFGRKPKLTPHQQQEALERRARGDALGLTSPDPMQSHTQLSHVSRNKVGQTANYGFASLALHHNRTSPSGHGYGKRIRREAGFSCGVARWTSERTTRDSRSCRPCS